jgi:poly(A) polymerase
MATPRVPPSTKPPCDREDALAVLKRLRDAGHVAYFAGGCVRDLLMGLQPTDYDIATDAPPRKVRKLFSNTQAVGAAFGVILVRHRRSIVEVATFRAEGQYLDGRHPAEVHFTNAEQDARRRDFTINGLFLDPLTDPPTDPVIDYVGGRDDLAARRLRAIGDPNERFEEDHLRLLRAIRFAARFDLTIDPATADAIRSHAPLLKRISPERIAEELRLMLTPPTRTAAWPMLWHFALIDVIFRFLPSAESADFDPTHSIFLSLKPGEPISFGLVLAAAALCYHWQSRHAPPQTPPPGPQAGPEPMQPAAVRVPAPDLRTLLQRPRILSAVKAIRQALRISNDEADEMRQILETIEVLLRDTPPTLAMKKRFLATPHARSALALLHALDTLHQSPDRLPTLLPELQELAGTEVAPPPLITGDDLTAAGLTPGPAFKQILDRVYDAQLEHRVQTHDQAKQMAMAFAREFGTP